MENTRTHKKHINSGSQHPESRLESYFKSDSITYNHMEEESVNNTKSVTSNSSTTVWPMVFEELIIAGLFLTLVLTTF